MPGVFQLSLDEMLTEAARAHAVGVPAVLLFGLPDRKDAKASGAYAHNGIVQQAVRLLKKELPQLLVITDVCLCEYMSHGHCGVVHRGAHGTRILNDPTLKLLARTAASHAFCNAPTLPTFSQARRWRGALGAVGLGVCLVSAGHGLVRIAFSDCAANRRISPAAGAAGLTDAGGQGAGRLHHGPVQWLDSLV